MGVHCEATSFNLMKMEKVSRSDKEPSFIRRAVRKTIWSVTDTRDVKFKKAGWRKRVRKCTVHRKAYDKRQRLKGKSRANWA